MHSRYLLTPIVWVTASVDTVTENRSTVSHRMGPRPSGSTEQVVNPVISEGDGCSEGLKGKSHSSGSCAGGTFRRSMREVWGVTGGEKEPSISGPCQDPASQKMRFIGVETRPELFFQSSCNHLPPFKQSMWGPPWVESSRWWLQSWSFPYDEHCPLSEGAGISGL